ncbi:MAG: hypothetical protein IIZ47_01375, partial [Erysipelotrichaceae bacterium]|nr:hypothetical protein [Erysipelotrichaceae bacterium]
MKPVSRDLFKDYRPLSDIQFSKDGRFVTFVSTKTDMAKNGYVQKLHILDTKTKDIKTLLPYKKRMTYYSLDEGLLLTDPNSRKKGWTSFLRVSEDGKTSKAFSVPLSVSSLEDFDEDRYLAVATTNRACSGFYALSEAKQKAWFRKQEDNGDYIVLDEYPFCYNGAGITNGNRETLFLIDKKTFAIERVTSETMDVESHDVKKGKILWSGTDFTNFKGKWSKVYEYDVKTKKTKCLYDGVMQIQRVCYLKGKIIVLGTFAKEWGAMEASKFYELKKGEMEFLLDNEYTFYNAVLSDARYGKTRSFHKTSDKLWFATCTYGKTVVVSFDGKKLETVLDTNGTVDDFCVKEDGTIYTVLMKDQALEEVYCFKNGELKKLTSVNEKVLKDRYVAVPEEVVLDKA